MSQLNVIVDVPKSDQGTIEVLIEDHSPLPEEFIESYIRQVIDQEYHDLEDLTVESVSHNFEKRHKTVSGEGTCSFRDEFERQSFEYTLSTGIQYGEPVYDSLEVNISL